MSANCPVCGRFAKATRRAAYDGTWNQVYVTTHCRPCGKHTTTEV